MTKKQRFTGGDHLAGFEKKVHDVFMKTELNNGLSAYEVNRAPTGTSGLTFGGNQMDLANGKPEEQIFKKKLFLDILKNASDTTGNKILNGFEYENIESNKKVTEKGLKPETVFGNLLPKVNDALSSEYGRQKINEAYIPVLKGKIAHVDGIIKSLTNEANRNELQSNEELQIRLVDYHNQFGLDRNGAMHRLLNGEKIKVYGKNKIKLDEVINKNGIEKFIKTTQFYNETPQGKKAVDIRLEKLDNHFEGNDVPSLSKTFKTDQLDFISNANIHQIKAGDTLGTIAKNNGMTLEGLLATKGNERFKDNPHSIKIGDKINMGPSANGGSNSEPGKSLGNLDFSFTSLPPASLSAPNPYGSAMDSFKIQPGAFDRYMSGESSSIFNKPSNNSIVSSVAKDMNLFPSINLGNGMGGGGSSNSGFSSSADNTGISSSNNYNYATGGGLFGNCGSNLGSGNGLVSTASIGMGPFMPDFW